VKFRPYFFEFIREMKMYYELIIYSSVTSKFNEVITHYIQSKEGSVFSHCLSSHHCVLDSSKASIKSLDMLCGNRKLDEMLCIDSCYSNFMLHAGNIVPLTQFVLSTAADNELIKLTKLLKEVANSGESAVDFIKKRVYAVQNIL
jgi:TFIIF-interacting CTD phosphatase-like protein